MTKGRYKSAQPKRYKKLQHRARKYRVSKLGRKIYRIRKAFQKRIAPLKQFQMDRAINHLRQIMDNKYISKSIGKQLAIDQDWADQGLQDERNKSLRKYEKKRYGRTPKWHKSPNGRTISKT